MIEHDQKDSNSAKRVLLVEDSKADLMLIERALKELSQEIVIDVAESINDAYKQFKTNRYDFVILDLNLPDGHGASSVSEIKRINKNVPIIVLTGISYDLLQKNALKNGADDFVIKTDILNDAFKNIIKKYL